MSKRIWVGIGIAIAVISGLAWLLADEFADWIVGIFSQWRTVDPVLREDIRQGVQIIAALAGVGSFIFSVINFLKGQKQTLPDSRDLLKSYYSALHRSCEKIDLSLVDEKFLEYARSVHGSITLPIVYQEMDVSPLRSERKADRPDERFSLGQERQALLQAVAVDEYQRVVVLGDAGSGKSMFMDNLAWHVSGSHISKLHEKLPIAFRYLPIVRVRFRAAAWRCKERGIATENLIWQAIEDSIIALVGEDSGKATWKILKPELLTRGLILMDGVDEVPETDGLRRKMLEAIDWLVKDLQPQARLIITSRPYVFEEENEYWLQPFACLELQLMRNEQVQQFIQNWYSLLRDARGYTSAAAQREASLLFTDLYNRSDLLDFARSPLILTLLTSLHFAHGILPHSRAKLFDAAIALMLERWTQRSHRESPDYPLEEFERRALRETEHSRKAALQALALTAHDHNSLQMGDREIRGLFAEYFSADCNPNNLLDFIRYRSGLLRPGDGNSFSFYHRLFQAYLAALAITDMDDWQDALDQRVRADKNWWGEVFLLLISAKVAGNSKPDAVSFLSSYYVPDTIDYLVYPEDEWQYLFLAARAVIEQKKPLQGYHKPQYAKLRGSLEKHLLYLVENQQRLPITTRAEAGRLLGELGDPRQGIGLIKAGKHQGLPDIDWIKIEGGVLQMGFDAAEVNDDFFKHATPKHPVPISTFNMSRYPVTNAQFRAFVEDGGYEQEHYWRNACPAAYDWWRGSKADLSLLDDNRDLQKRYEAWLAREPTRRQPWYWDDKTWNNPNHPVVGISWYEALAFCEWLNEKEVYPNPVGLPTEAEWEYAARGTTGWCYAWGNEPNPDKGNYDETGLAQTSSVGLFEPSKAFGLYDMSGNVWEWTSSQWGQQTVSPDFTYDQWLSQNGVRDALNAHALRIMRGGAWDDLTDNLRCAVRGGYHPVNRFNTLGFRLRC